MRKADQIIAIVSVLTTTLCLVACSTKYESEQPEVTTVSSEETEALPESDGAETENFNTVKYESEEPEATAISVAATEALIESGDASRENFNTITINPMDTNVALLNDIIQENKDTEYGNIYDFSSINDYADYVRCVPLSNYGDYEDYIKRMYNGESNLIFAATPAAFAVSEEDSSMIPLTMTTFSGYNSYGAAYAYSLFNKEFGDEWSKDTAFSLAQCRYSLLMQGENEILVGPFNGLMAGGLSRDNPNLREAVTPVNTTPMEAIFYNEEFEYLYPHARFGLTTKRAAGFRCVEISEELELWSYLEENWEWIVDDIRNGTISEKVDLPEELRSDLEGLIEPMPDRADELEKIFENGFSDIIKDIWPNAAFIFVVVGDENYEESREKLEKYAGEVPIHVGGFLTDECVVGVTTEVKGLTYTLLPDSVFYEFIPVESVNETIPQTLTMDQLEVGQEYQMVITTKSGFYRYRTKKVVKITGKYNDTPQFEYSYSVQ